MAEKRVKCGKRGKRRIKGETAKKRVKREKKGKRREKRVKRRNRFFRPVLNISD